MATAAFVQGSQNAVLELHQIPAAKGRAFWPLHEQKLAADLYEQEHPGVTVKRPWEKEAEHQARLAKRKRTVMPEPELNMDPARAESELSRKVFELGGLSPDHPEYERLWASLTKYIHQLEAILGRAPTTYVKGRPAKKKEDPVDPALVEKLAKYKALKPETRRKSVQAGTDTELLALMRDNETDPEIQALAVQRIEQLRAANVDEAVA